MKELIEKLVKDMITMTLVRAKVTAVSDQVIDVTPISEDADILDVKIRVVEDDNEAGVMIYPVIDSVVLVGLIDDTDAYLLQCSEVERMVIKTENFRLEVDAQGNVVFNNGTNSGLVILPKLAIEIEKLNSYLNAIKQTFNSFVPVPGDGGAALKTAMSAALATLPFADLSEVGNDKIKH